MGMGGPRPTSWDPIALPSCFLSGLLGGIPISFFHSDGWAAAKKLGFIELTSYLLSGVLGRMGGGLPLGSCFLLSGLLARMGGPRPTSWAPIGIPSSFLSGLLGRMSDRDLCSRWVS